MKKVLVYLVLILTILSFTACGKKVAVSNDGDSHKEVEETSDKTSNDKSDDDDEADEKEADNDDKDDDKDSKDDEEEVEQPDVDKITVDDPTEAFETLCVRALEAAKNNDIEAMSKLILDADDDTAQNYIDGFNNVNDCNYPDFQYFVFLNNGNNYAGEIFNTLTTGQYPDVKVLKHTKFIFFVYNNGEWLFSDSQEVANSLNEKVGDLYPEEFMDALKNGRNGATFETNDYVFADDSIVWPGHVDARVYAAWQNDDGSVGVMVAVKNGTDEIRKITSMKVTITDDSLGTIIDANVSFTEALAPNTGSTVIYTIPAEYVYSGTNIWGYVHSHVEASHQ